MKIGVPRLHPSGFVQVDLDEHRQVNIWDDALLPAQAINTPVHDHTFSFMAYIVAGVLTNIVYTFVPNVQHGDYQLWGVEPWKTGEETILSPLPGMVGDVDITETEELPRGYAYQLRAGWFHETKHKGFTVALRVTTEKNVTPAARVIMPVGDSVDNDPVARQRRDRLVSSVGRALPYLRGEDAEIITSAWQGR